MMITRSLGKIVLGHPTLTQLGLTCVLATIWGFVPGFDTAPLTVLLLVCCMLVLKTNLALAALVAGAAKIAALLLTPVSFRLGMFLLEGPTSGLYRALINAPGTAMMGFDHYLTAGSSALGLLLGLVCARLFTRRVKALRLMFADLERGHTRYQEHVEKGWVRFLCRILLGVNVKEMTPRFESTGGPIRLAGVAVTALAAGTLYWATPLLEGWFAEHLRAGLARTNGATVDVSSMHLDFADGRLVLEDLAMADPEKLSHDRFRAGRAEVDLSVSDLLRGRLVFDRIEATGSRMDVPREVPGKHIGTTPSERPARHIDTPTYEDLKAYWQQAEVWYARLRRMRSLLEDVAGVLPDSNGEGERAFADWLADEVAAKGYAYVRALHLLDGSPALLVRTLKIHDIENPYFNGEVLHLDATDLSSSPSKVAGAPTIKTASGGGTFLLDIRLNEAAAQPAPSHLTMTYRGMPLERITAQLSQASDRLQGGTVDFSLDGAFQVADGSRLDPPLEARLHNVTLILPRVDPVGLDDFPVVVHLGGSLDRPRIKFDHEAFIEALRKRGLDAVVASYKKQLKDEVDARVDAEKDKLEAKAREKLDAELKDKAGDELKGRLGGLLEEQGDGKPAPPAGEPGDKTAEETPAAPEKDLQKTLGGLLGGKRDKQKTTAPPETTNAGTQPADGETAKDAAAAPPM